MSFLLDTNVISEVSKPNPDPGVLQWLDELDEDRTFLSVVTLAEIRRGIGLMDEGKRRKALAEWFETELIDRFEGRLLAIDEKTALIWGDLLSASKKRGVALSTMDGWIAATALARDLTLATRNVKDFEPHQVQVFNPWP